MSQQPTPASVFDDHLSAWKAWQLEPWGRLRYAVVAHVLSLYLPALGTRVRILDVGGGDGTEAIRLAQLGHEVTIVDSSAPLLAIARASASEQGVTDRVTTVERSAEDLGALGVGAGAFDLALCHFVIQYLAEPRVVAATIARHVRPGGLISLIAPNPASEVLGKAVRHLDFPAAQAMLTAETAYTATFEHEVARIAPDDGEAMLQTSGFDLLGRYGGRIVMDLLVDNDVKYDSAVYASIERLEIALCGQAPYRDIGRFWQLVGRRQAATKSG